MLKQENSDRKRTLILTAREVPQQIKREKARSAYGRRRAHGGVHSFAQVNPSHRPPSFTASNEAVQRGVVPWMGPPAWDFGGKRTSGFTLYRC